MMNDEQFAWWLVGLVDGEGHLGVTRYHKSNGDGPYFRCVFRVVMAVDDRALLETASERTGWGALYQYDRKTAKANGSPHRPFCVWTVNTKADLPAVAEFFDAHPLQSKKAAEFAIWREAVAANVARARLGRGRRDEATFAILNAAYESLRSLRSY